MKEKNKEQIEFSKLQRRLKINKRLSYFNYRGERTLVVIAGMNADNVNLKKVVGLTYYEERMLFFLFLLKYKNTKIIYVTSKGFNEKLFDYYLSLVSKNPKKISSLKSRLTHVAINDNRVISVTEKTLENSEIIRKIKKAIENPKTAQLRCYNPSLMERKLALKLGIPLFGGGQKFDFLGTKSGGRKAFRLAGINYIPGYSYLKNFDELTVAMAKLMRDHPYYKKLMVKLDLSSSGRGNAIFKVKEFLKENDIEISSKINIEKLAKQIKKNFCKYVSFQMAGQDCAEYIKEYYQKGGIAELYIPGENKYSPSVQLLINPDGKPIILSTHEQILGGPDKQKYLGCLFPARTSHRKIIIKEAKKVAAWMAKKGLVGYFGIDFVVVYKDKNPIPKVYPIEINLRKGGTTHPFRIAHFLTSAKYNSRQGMLYCGKTPIYYLAMDIIYNKNYKKIGPMELIDLVQKSSVNFNKNTKRGVLVFMPGTIKKYGRFGAICIGHTRKEAERYYKRLIKLVDKYSL